MENKVVDKKDIQMALQINREEYPNKYNLHLAINQLH